MQRAGAVLRSLRGHGFAACHVQFPPGGVLETHVHELPFLTITLAGGAREYIGSRAGDVVAGTVRFSPAGLEHRLVNGRHGAEVCAVELEADFRYRDLWPENIVVDRSERHLQDLGRSIVRELTIGDELAAVAIEGILLEVAAWARRDRSPARKPPPFLAAVVDRLRSAERPLSMSELAREAGVHPGHLSRTFVQHLGRTPAEYQRQLRIDQAMDLLRTTDLRVGEIALRLGFYDETHFARVFKRMTGWTPSAFRAHQR